MELFKLQALLELSTQSFSDAVETAKTDVKSVGDAIDDISEISPDMSVFNDSVSEAMNTAAKDAKDASSAVSEVGTTSTAMMGVVEGFASATGELIEKTIESIIEFGKEAIEIAAQSGSESAQAYLAAVDEYEYVMHNFKESIGELLLPAATSIKETITGIFSTGFEDSQRIREALEGIASVSFANLKGVREELDGIFSLFETVEEPESADVGSMTDALESQAAYWQEYAALMTQLEEKGVNKSLISQMADGSTESMAQMQAIAAASNEELAALTSAYEEMQTAQDAVAQGISTTRLAVDEEFQSILSTFVDFVAKADDAGQKAAELELRMAATQEALASYGSEVDGYVESTEAWLTGISEKLAAVGLESLVPDIVTARETISAEAETLRASVAGSASAAADELTNVQSVGDALAESAWEPSITAQDNATSTINKVENELKDLDGKRITVYLDIVQTGNTDVREGRAVGLDYVPFNEYPVNLHEGEAVLTKLEAERWRRGEAPAGSSAVSASAAPVYNVTVNVNETSASVDDISDAVLQAIDLARWRA